MIEEAYHGPAPRRPICRQETSTKRPKGRIPNFPPPPIPYLPNQSPSSEIPDAENNRLFPIVFPANFPAPRPSKTSFWHLVRRKVRLCESKALEKAPAAGKSAIVRVFRLSRLARSHFSLQRRRFSRSEPGSQGRGDPKRPFRNPRLAKLPPPTGTPADASPGYVPQTYLTGASYERALRKREGKWAR
mgnify:CR=1 FL=1